MKIVAICGSPRKGNTEFILRAIIGSAKQKDAATELILLREKKIKFCDGCDSCNKGVCHIKDNMQQIYNLMRNADFIILGSPNYWNNVSGQMKVFIDRCVPFYFSKKLEGKKIILVGVGGESGDAVINSLSEFCSGTGMVVKEKVSVKAYNSADASKDRKLVEKLKKLGCELTK